MNKDIELLAEAYQSILAKKPVKAQEEEEECGCEDESECTCGEELNEAKAKAKKKKELTPKQKKIAAAAPPYDEITRADIITLAKKKKK
jgi:hypothetical protein